jgi:hypothetical protein
MANLFIKLRFIFKLSIYIGSLIVIVTLLPVNSVEDAGCEAGNQAFDPKHYHAAKGKPVTLGYRLVTSNHLFGSLANIENC